MEGGGREQSINICSSEERVDSEKHKSCSAAGLFGDIVGSSTRGQHAAIGGSGCHGDDSVVCREYFRSTEKTKFWHHQLERER
ncbi:hypothetical protein CDAR_583681 [Caerostris darwini]|uniref:Uncharacterized protein n=1 Tax=Caerostris darwini TaxID=1538125 RepID=A0AAV4QRD4_9ARAC|nr:hypothetical protein CDAR_583681 [Caerostris darwini]